MSALCCLFEIGRRKLNHQSSTIEKIPGTNSMTFACSVNEQYENSVGNSIQYVLDLIKDRKVNDKKSDYLCAAMGQ